MMADSRPAEPPKEAPGQEHIWGIVGYRRYADREAFDRHLGALVATHGRPDRVVSGGAPGADTMARDWARANGIPFTEYPPAAQTASAFKARNSLIVQAATLLVAFLSRDSRGTLDTIAKARKAGKPLITVRID